MADPPVRWRDLRRAAEGDQEAIGQFRGVIARFDEAYPSLVAQGLDEYSFLIVQPRDFVNDPRYSSPSNIIDYGEFEGQRYVYSLWRYREESRGWPMEWVSWGIWDTYAYGDRRFSADGVLSVDHDMIHKTTRDPKRIAWLNLLFLALVAFGCAGVARKVCLWRFENQRVAQCVGMIVLGLLVGVVAVGYTHRVLRDRNVIEGSFDPLTTAQVRVWTREELNIQIASDSSIQAFARILIEDLGTMTEPNALVGMGIRPRGVNEDIRWSFGLSFF